MKSDFEMLAEPVCIEKVSIFNSRAFLTRNNDQVMQFIIRRGNSIVACIHFTIKGDKAYSPWKASFGGLEIFAEISKEELGSFMAFFLKNLRHQGARQISITVAPEFYFPDLFQPFNECATEFGFTSSLETGQFIKVTEVPFYELITRYEARKLSRSLASNMAAEVVMKDFPLEAYEMIRKNRERRKIPVTVDFCELKQNCMNFSEQFISFIVRMGRDIAAASIGIKVRDDVLYHFFPGHDVKFDDLSPMVLLIAKEYEFCQRNNLKILDLGLSSENGIVNRGLYRFKSNLGAVDYQQVKFTLGGK